MSWFLLYILKIFFLNLKGIFDASIVSITKKEYGSSVHFLYILTKSLVLMSVEWFIAICWSSLLFGIFAFYSNKWFGNHWIEFFIMNHIYNHVIKNFFLPFFIRIIIINIFIKFLYFFILILNKSFRIFKMIYTYTFSFIN